MKQVNHLSEANQSAKGGSLNSVHLTPFATLGQTRQGLSERFFTKSAYQTRKLGQKLAKKVLKSKPKRKAVVLALEGELGSGKTTFLQGFAKGLGVKEKILSPTFIILKRLKIKDLTPRQKLSFGTGQGFKFFYHVDCYRLKKPKELLDLGFKGIIPNHQNIVAVEWAERIEKVLPKGAIRLKFKFIDKNTRKISIIIPKRIL